MKFWDREDAGRQLAEKLLPYKEMEPIVLALPRGGVPIGIEVAKALEAPLDLLIIRKIGHPAHPEYAIGALGEEGDPLLHPAEARMVDQNWLESEINRQRQEIKRRKQAYLPAVKKAPWKDRTILLVDDGAATGFTMFAAIRQLREMGVKQIIGGLPVVSPDTFERLEGKADDMVAVEIPQVFLGGVGAYYNDFHQVSDMEVIALLEEFHQTSHE